MITLILVLFFLGGSWISAEQFNENSDKSTKIYWKAEGQKWKKIHKKNLRIVKIEEDASGPPQLQVMDTSAANSDGSTLLKPYIAISVGSWAEVVAIGDLNNDGKNDVVLGTASYNNPENDNKIFVFLQNSAGGLNTPVKYTPSLYFTSVIESIATKDMNNDGKDDVVIGGSGGGIEVFLQNENGSLDQPVPYTNENAYKIASGDFNNDGLNDLAGISWGSSLADVYHQDDHGNLVFTYQANVQYAGYNDLESGDVNGDGLDDLVVMSGQSYAVDNLGILYQDISGVFNSAVYYDLGFDRNTSGVGIGDINNDNLNDVVVTYGGNRPNSYIGCFYQNSSGDLDPAVSFASYDIPESIVIKDINMDGLADIVVAHGGWNRTGVYLQDQDGSIDPELLFPIPYASHYNPHGLSVGDINGDGSNDIVLADYNSGLIILYNDLSIPQEPVLKIQANGVSDVVSIGKKETCTVTVTLDPGMYLGQIKDLWIHRTVKNKTYWYSIENNQWIISSTPIRATTEVLQMIDSQIIYSTLPRRGSSVFTIACDDNGDGVYDATYKDQVIVEVK